MAHLIPQDRDIPGQDEHGQHAPHKDPTGTKVGGSIDKPAFALLAGVRTDPDGSFTKCGFPITRIPATIGRAHKDADINFIGLSPMKSLSRHHCLIYWRDIMGGKLDMKSKSINATKKRGLLKYTVASASTSSKKAKVTSNPNDDDAGGGDGDGNDGIEVDAKDIIIPPATPSEEARTNAVDELPKTGFWVVKCLGKNKIQVNGYHVSKGQVALLRHGSALKLANHQLYFLLPKDGTAPPDILKVPNPLYDPSKRRKTTTTKAGGGLKPFIKRNDDDEASSMSMTIHQPVGGVGGAVNDMHEHYSAEELMTIMDDAVRANQWERRHQMVGTAVAYHAVVDAGRSKEIQHIAQKEGGASRSEIMKWIKASDKYKKWYNHMQSKMEFKSFQSSIGKALAKAGFERTGTTGRYVRWILPKNIPITHVLGDGDEHEAEEEDGDDDDQEQEEEEPKKTIKGTTDGMSKKAPPPQEDSSDSSSSDTDDKEESFVTIPKPAAEESEDENEEEDDDDEDDDNESEAASDVGAEKAGQDEEEDDDEEDSEDDDDEDEDDDNSNNKAAAAIGVETGVQDEDDDEEDDSDDNEDDDDDE